MKSFRLKRRNNKRRNRSRKLRRGGNDSSSSASSSSSSSYRMPPPVSRNRGLNSLTVDNIRGYLGVPPTAQPVANAPISYDAMMARVNNSLSSSSNGTGGRRRK